jgi:hypothetical protein
MVRSFAVLLSALALAAPLSADVHLAKRSDGSVVMFNDNVGSGWRVNGKAPTDAYLIGRGNAPSPFDDTIWNTSARHGVDPKLVKSVMLVESNFNPAAVSRKGARGLMQLMPKTARSYGVSNVHAAPENISGGVRYLADLLTTFRGDVPLALAAYNAGEGAVTKYSGVPPYPETQEYVRRVMVAYNGRPSTIHPAYSAAPSLGGTATGPTPALAGGFRGTRASVHMVPVKVADWNGTTLLSNDGDPQREAPVLGRVR